VAPAIPSALGTQTEKLLTPALAQKEMEQIESLFSQGEYTSAVAQLATLKNSINAATELNKRNEYLARIHFLWGPYFVITDKPTVAVQHFETVLQHDPELIPTAQFSDKIMELFNHVKGGPIKILTAEKSEPAPKEPPEAKAEVANQGFFKGLQVRLVKENASLKVDPDPKALSIRDLPLGALLTAEGKVGDWIKIKLPPDKDGIIIVGYVHISVIKPEI
jgi:hypothetical protein